MAPSSEDPNASVSPTENPVQGDSALSANENAERVPVHPIPQLQGPFEESILEALEDVKEEWEVNLDAQSRRRDLLENPEYVRLCGRKWRQRRGERQAFALDDLLTTQELTGPAGTIHFGSLLLKSRSGSTSLSKNWPSQTQRF